MNRTLLSILILVSTLWLANAQGRNSAQDTILKLEQQWDDALTHADTAALEKLYDDTLIYTHSSGKVDTKTSYIDAIKSGAAKYQSMRRDDIKVNVYPQAAVVSCHWEVQFGGGGKLNARYLHVYVRRRGDWKLVAHESTRVAP